MRKSSVVQKRKVPIITSVITATASCSCFPSHCKGVVFSNKTLHIKLYGEHMLQ